MIKKLRSSIFDFNTAFLNLSDNDIAEITGIDIKRVKLLASGEEPLLSDIIAMSATFDRSILSLLAGEYLCINSENITHRKMNFWKKS